MNYVSIMKLIRLCESETPAQLLLEHTINEAIIAEREACASVCEKASFEDCWTDDADYDGGMLKGADECAKAIRERGEKK